MKTKLDIIDSHMHIESWFDEVGRDFFEIFDKAQDIANLKSLSINAIPVLNGVENNIMAALYKLHNPTAYAMAGLVYPSFPTVTPLPDTMDFLSQYKELKDIGFDGFKILYKPDCQHKVNLRINSDVYEDFFAYAEKDNANILWHLADPEDCWSDGVHKDNKDFLSTEEMYKDALDVLKRHPKLNVTFAHFMFLSNFPNKLMKILDTYENVSIDVTPGAEMYTAFTQNRDFYRKFFSEYSDRIMFGSDNQLPWDESAHLYFGQFDKSIVFGSKSTLPPSSVSADIFIKAIYNALASDEDDIDILRFKIRGLNLSQDICSKILSKNFIAKHSDTPKKINIPALKKYIEKYKDLIWSEENKKQILEYANNL